jgi:Flp pilus assembly protein TadG
MHMIGMPRFFRLQRFLGALYRDRSGLALTEFALATPIVIAIGGYGIELSHLALTNLKVNQIALNLADNASRVGLTSTLTTTQLRETDVNDVLIGARLQGAGINLTTNGRVTISSLENVQQSYDTAAVQRIHWQRCIGKMSTTGYTSSYGTTTVTAGQTATLANAGTAAPTGMGDTGSLVSAPVGSGVMFIEINYKYQGLFGSLFIGNRIIHYTASFIVRDNRDYAQIYPSSTVTGSTCDLFQA